MASSRIQLLQHFLRCTFLCMLFGLFRGRESSSQVTGEASLVEDTIPRGSIIEFNSCERWHSDRGIRGKLVAASVGEPALELESCGLSPVCQIDFERFRRLLLVAIGPLQVTEFSALRAGTCDWRSAHMQEFAEAAAATLLRDSLDIQTCRADVAVNDTEDDVLIERAVVEGLAAASTRKSSSSGCKDDLQDTSFNLRPNHSALAAVTIWMRDRENSLEWNAEHDRLRSECLAEGDLRGYECRTFTYGSTYFPSWLHVMRFPAVSEALKDARAAGGRDVVVLGSSLGWQTLWSALTFGIRSVGYELMDHRVDAARLAAGQVAESTEGLVEFHHKDALSSDLTNAVIIYLTDLIWEDYLVVQVANHVKQSLLKSGIGRRAVVISNKYTSWSKMKFEHLGTLEVPVTWTAHQEFHYWRLSPYASQR